ncbi:hypothetical protein Poli38472_001870 [Pythium oligandrum]|uniref:non-specific serine/threonine protein kinase n=1 Tax=Pythium oligandrum TaxID=41045 RepID=A0A8K1CUE0_PYTOL|nr:hypothetical protein Poli38472_001870 [Pythium oligandrum]|eukprot:TMW69714.1 hypothetical protein Poli38472_001870 [Pythium oligandrum]
MGNVQQYIGKRVEVGQYQVEVVKYIGEGGSSFIFLVKDVQRESARPMVLKRLVAENDAAYVWIQREIEMHQRFRHPQVVEFYASQSVRKGRTEREVFILMEYCPLGHLHENLTKMGEKRFKEKDLLRLFRSLCVPVNLLHHNDPPIAHRDLKLENFLMAPNGVYKLCDFGSCVEGPQSLKTKEDRVRETEHVLKRTTAMYRSPELADVDGTAMFGSGELTEAVDIWAMGCVLYTLAFFKPPFPPEGLRTERYTIPKESKFSADLHQLIARMLQADVERRATMDHVIECIDALMGDRPLPKNLGAASPRKAPPASAAPKKPATASGPSSRENSSGAAGGVKKTTEARKESVPAQKPASDLLEIDFNPTITAPPPLKTASSGSDPFGAGAGWTNAAPAGGFADFASFPASPSKFGAMTTPMPTPVPSGSSSFDAFGFPASPVKTTPPQQQQQHYPTGMTQPQGYGFGAAPAPPAAPVDPFEGLGGLGGTASAPHAAYPRGPGQPPHQIYQQGFQGMPQQQQPMWGQQQQQQPMWGHNGGNPGYPRGY